MKLIEAVKIQAGCELDSELRNLTVKKKKWLADIIEERVPSGLATIDDWNELLWHFMGAAPESNNKLAKKKLLCYLRHDEAE